MSNKQIIDYESMMTVGKAAYIGVNQDPDLTTLTLTLPMPEGQGWKLEQVIPVHNNPKYLQYFWQREYTRAAEEGTDAQGVNFRSGSIKLGIG